MAVSLEHTIAEMKKHFTPQGFYVQKDRELFLLDLIQQANQGELFQDYPQYGLALFSTEKDLSAEGVVFPEKEAYVEKGDSILAIGYSSDTEQVIHSEGTISDIDELEEVATFTVQVAPHFSSRLYSVFLIDRIHSALNFLGVFSFSLGKVVHVAGFDQNLRGPHITRKSQCGQFRGTEEGNRGAGSRSICISHPDLPGGEVRYSLKFVQEKKRLNPHHDHSYTQNDENKEALYQTALDIFVDQYKAQRTIPENFSFLCYKKKSEYVATLE